MKKLTTSVNEFWVSPTVYQNRWRGTTLFGVKLKDDACYNSTLSQNLLMASPLSCLGYELSPLLASLN